MRFDGLHFTVFDREKEPAFRDDSVYSLLAGKDGSLWAGTEGGGLIRYKDGIFRAYGTREGLSNGFIRTIFEDRANVVWVGTDRGLFRQSGDGRFQRVDGRDGIPAISVHAITEDRAGRLLVGGTGILMLSGSSHVYYRSRGPNADNSVRAILQSVDGSVWIGTISGLRKVPGTLADDPFTQPRLVDGVNISILRETNDGSLWIGTYGHGLLRQHGGRTVRFSASTGLPHNNVLAVFRDRENDLWVGTQGGLLRLSPSAAITITTPDRVPQGINTIYADPQGTLFVAALNGRLFQVEGRTLEPFPLPRALQGVPVRNAFRDRQGVLWVGTDGQGMFRVQSGRAEQFSTRNGLVNDFVRAFCEDREGSLWIGTDGGVSRLAGGRFTNFDSDSGLSYGSIRVLLADRSRDLWVGTDGGISHLRNGSFVAEPALDRLRGEKIWAIHQDTDGDLWIGTHGAGLFLFRKGTLSEFGVQHGLSAQKVHSILEDRKGQLWMSGPTGIVSVSRHDLKKVAEQPPGNRLAVHVYGTADGLSTNQMNGGVQPSGAVTSDGELWFPGTRGAVRLRPGLLESAGPPPVLIEQVIGDDKPAPLTGLIRLPPGRGKLEIHYTAVRLRSPERLRFRYLMEGFDQDWTDAGQRRVAYYTNLPPGDYRFRVAAYETAEPGASSERVLALHWMQPFYRTWPFVAACGVLVLSAIWGAYRIHVRNVRMRYGAVLEERNRMAREMHDTLIQGCVGVSALLEAASTAQDVSPMIGHQLVDRARDEIRATVDEARRAVWNLRRESEPSDSFAAALGRLIQRVSEEAGIAVSFEQSGNAVAIGAEGERNLLLLIREALQNAVRHGAPGKVAVRLLYERSGVSVRVEDDGRGFNTETAFARSDSHYGLVGMRERVQKLGGEFQLTSMPGEGTRVSARIPVPRS